MQTKLSQPTLFFAIALLILSSCEKTPNAIPPDKGTIAVALNIASATATRLAADGIVDGTSTPFPENGYMFFTDFDGNIKHRYTITDAPTDLSAGTIDYRELRDASLFFTEMSNEVTEVLIIANVPSDINQSYIPDEEENISGLSALTFDINTQTFDTAYMIGSNTLTPTGESAPGGTPNVPLYRALVKLRATFAIIEIEGVGAMGDQTNPITGFTLDAIFIGNYYSETTLDGTPTGTKMPIDTTVPGTSAVHDTNINRSGNLHNNMTARPDGNNQVWRYKIFAQHHLADNPQGVVPEIKLQMSNIILKDNSSTANATMTLNRFFNETGEDVAFLAGRVYRINPVFQHNDQLFKSARVVFD
jgi:hypothetical protein